MSLSKISVRELLVFSILVFSLFLFTQNSNAQVILFVDSCGGGGDATACDDGMDDGDCTIRGAATQAGLEDDDVEITVDPTLICPDDKIELDGDNQIFLSNPASAGAADNDLTIFGNQNITITKVSTMNALLYNHNGNPWQSVTLEDLGFADRDRSDAGGTAIDHNGTGPLTCERCTFSGLTNSDAGGGGAGILAQNAGDLIVIDSLFENNNGSGTDNCPGCGIRLTGSGDLTCTTSTFVNNQAGGGSGGGIVFFPSDSNASLTSNGCNFTGNGSSNGGALATFSGIVNVTDGNFTGNTTTGDGGAVRIKDQGGPLAGDATFTGVTFDMNTATAGSGGAVAIDSSYGSMVTSTGCIFTNNDAVMGGALEISNGSATITGGNFTGNFADGDGGAVCIQGATTGDVTFSAVTFNLNEANIAGGDFNDGGAIFIANDCTNTTTVSGCNITDNTARNFGGGICLDSTTAKLVVDSGTLIDGNTATLERGGGVATSGETIINNSTISNNYAPFAGKSGGGIDFAHPDPIVSEIKNGSVISGNEAGVDGVSRSTGGGFHVATSEVIVTNSTIENNKAFSDGGGAGGDGGGFAVDGGAKLTIIGSTVQNNTAGRNGGGGFNEGELNVDPTSFIANFALGLGHEDGGGGLHNTTAGVVTLDCTTFSMNEAIRGFGGGGADGGDGGAINNRGELYITSSLFYDNFAEDDGGAIYNETVEIVNMLNTTFVENVADDEGGAIANNNPGMPIEISFCTFKDNVADLGQTFFNDGDIELINSVLDSQINNNCENTPPEDMGFNWETGDSCAFGVNSTQLLDPQLGVLGNFGGCINTCPPTDTSPIKDLIPPGLIISVPIPPGDTVLVDAIGLPRPPVGFNQRYNRCKRDRRHSSKPNSSKSNSPRYRPD